MNDYNDILLRTYFKENKIDNQTKQKLLENNPFNEKYMKWEYNYKKTNKILAFAIKDKKLISKDSSIKELTAIGDINMSRFLRNDNDREYNFKKGTIVLARDSLYGNDSYLSKLIKSTPHFILGICTKDYLAYKAKRDLYKKIAKNNKDLEIIECIPDGYNVCIVRK